MVPVSRRPCVIYNISALYFRLQAAIVRYVPCAFQPDFRCAVIGILAIGGEAGSAHRITARQPLLSFPRCYEPQGRSLVTAK